MAVLSKDDFMKRLQERFGETEDDEELSLIEDFTDTYNDLETRTQHSEEETWKTKYTDLQKKYRDRFFKGGQNIDDPDPEDDKPKVRRFEDLFT